MIDNAGYPKLGGLLRGKFLVGKNDVHRQRINDMTSVIYQRLNPFDVVPYLIQHGVISRDEGADICKIADKSRSHAALELQYILPNRHRHWYVLTLCSLMESNHKELAEILDSGLMKRISDNHCNELYRTGSDTSLQTLVESCYTHVDDLKEQLDAVAEKVLALKDKFQRHKDRLYEDLINVTKLKHDCKTKIEHFRIQINDILVKLETNLLMDLDINDSCLRTSILHHTQTVSAALRRLNDNYLKIQDAKLHLENENMISAHDLTTESLSKYETLYERIVKATITPLMDFKGNTQLKGLINNIGTLGTLVKCSIPENHAFSASAFSNLCDSGTTRGVSLGPEVNAASFNIQAFASTRRTDIKLPDDQCTPCVTGCSFMPNGELVICDRSNGRVKLLDHSWRIVNFVNFSIFPSGPRDISVWGRTSVIVTLPEKMQLVFIKVYPKMKSGSVIQLDKQ